MKLTIASLFALLSAVFAAMTAHAQNYPEYRHMWGDWGWGHMIFGPLVMIIFLAIAVAVVVLMIRWLGGSSHAAAGLQQVSPDKPPLDILKERFARGEIDEEEFAERRKVLEK